MKVMTEKLLHVGSRLLGILPPEEEHFSAMIMLRLWKLASLLPAPVADDSILATRLWGRNFQNPVGLAAGFDKNARVPDALLGLGFSFVEVGTVTPRPQAGNPRPRLFRLPADEALINRIGFNNDGLERIAHRLAARRQNRSCCEQAGWVGASLGQNLGSVEAIADYVQGVMMLAPLVNYLVINVSSPNTPGIRALQGIDILTVLVERVRKALDREMPVGCVRPPLLVKIAPDLTRAERSDIAAVALSTGLDGIIATNTTLTRPSEMRTNTRSEVGGLSGRPLFSLSTTVLADMYRLTGGRLPLIGVGGVASGADALTKIKAGASLVQVYTAIAYAGPCIVGRIKKELVQLLRAEGYSTVSEAVGSGVRISTAGS